MQETKYDIIGTGYNSTRCADLYLANRLFHLLQPKKDKLYLDIGCGTGNYTAVLADKGFDFIGVEPSERMLALAKTKSHKVNWLNGSAENIPAGDQVFDGVIATLTIHHWTNLSTAFAEISRVLSDGGRIVIFTSTPEQMKGYWLNHYFPQMLHDSMLQMPSLESITQAAEKFGLEVRSTEKYSIKDDLQDQFLYVGKNNPQVYFDEKVRNGISSFASLANRLEVEQGLQRLKRDIQDASFESIRGVYDNDWGDYLFIVISNRNDI